MMTPSGIPSARKKLDRAKFHLDTLRTEVHAFRADSPYDFKMTSPGNVPGKPDIYVTVMVTEAPSTPDSWALITGDILTNLRATLDHAVFPHIRAKKPDLHTQYIQYPIEDTKAQWENKTKWFKRSVSTVVGRSQPYRQTDPALRLLHPLRMLRELVNMDKHRELVIASYAAHAFEVEHRDLYKVISKEVHKWTPMSVGTVVAESHLELAQAVRGERWETIPCEIEYSECIEIPGCAEPQDLLAVMTALTDPIGSLLGELGRAGC